MEDDTNFVEYFLFVRLLPSYSFITQSIQFLRMNPILVMRIPTKCPMRTPTRRAQTSWPRTRLGGGGPDMFNSQKFNLDAAVTLAAAIFVHFQNLFS